MSLPKPSRATRPDPNKVAPVRRALVVKPPPHAFTKRDVALSTSGRSISVRDSNKPPERKTPVTVRFETIAD